MTSLLPLKIVLRHMRQPVDLLNNAKRVFDYAKNKEILAATQETSPSIGEKLSRLLSISEQQNGENKENGGNNEAFFPQVAGNATAGKEVCNPQSIEIFIKLDLLFRQCFGCFFFVLFFTSDLAETTVPKK